LLVGYHGFDRHIPGGRLLTEVSHKPPKQLDLTGCWVAAAYSVLELAGYKVTHQQLRIDYPGRVSADPHVSGSGQPSTILGDYAATHRRHEVVEPKLSGLTREQIIEQIHASVSAGIPVISQLRSTQIGDEWKHAVVIIGIDASNGKMSLSDPAQGPDHSQMVSYPGFFSNTFCYKQFHKLKDGSMVSVFAKCDYLLFFRVVPAAAAAATGAAGSAASPAKP
jgi:hypothetical protein